MWESYFSYCQFYHEVTEQVGAIFKMGNAPFCLSRFRIYSWSGVTGEKSPSKS
ncbi:hypothetical protein [Enterococcus faecalis]|uniref:hypothetical protein n=1 Tax=Enterococcus faecalis TaxID=1351 RepID=UPI002FDBE230